MPRNSAKWLLRCTWSHQCRGGHTKSTELNVIGEVVGGEHKYLPDLKELFWSLDLCEGGGVGSNIKHPCGSREMHKWSGRCGWKGRKGIESRKREGRGKYNWWWSPSSSGRIVKG